MLSRPQKDALLVGSKAGGQRRRGVGIGGKRRREDAHWLCFPSGLDGRAGRKVASALVGTLPRRASRAAARPRRGKLIGAKRARPKGTTALDPERGLALQGPTPGETRRPAPKQAP